MKPRRRKTNSVVSGLFAAEKQNGKSASFPTTPPETDDDGSDIEPTKTKAREFLSWRHDPECSFSDWKIEIVTTNEGAKDDSQTSHEQSTSSEVETYHVHKCILGVGPRRSEYFARLFRQDFAESRHSRSRIELPAIAARAFPELLDFMYAANEGSKAEFTTANATALYHLGKYFGMRQLSWAAKMFWRTNMTVQNCHVYYTHASILHEDNVLQEALRVCARKIHRIPTSSPFVQTFVPEFWVKLLETAAISNEFSSLASVLIAEFCHIHQANLPPETFRKLTNKQSLPEIHVLAALRLIELEQLLMGTPKEEAGSLSDLQRRCVHAICRDWKDVDFDDLSNKELLQKQSNRVIYEIMRGSLSAAKVQVQAQSPYPNDVWA